MFDDERMLVSAYIRRSRDMLWASVGVSRIQARC